MWQLAMLCHGSHAAMATLQTVLSRLPCSASPCSPCPSPACLRPQFCLTYKRTTEFRRLCDIVRNHLSNLLKYRDQGGRDRTDLK